MNRLIPFLPALAVFIVDRITKWIVQTRVSFWDNLTVIPGFFSIVHAENPGAAFGIFADSAGIWRTVLLIGLAAAVMILIVMQLWKQNRIPDHWTSRVGLSLVLGGALGNVFDRALAGTVTDFFEFYYREYQFPAFNVADSAITVGACLLLVSMWRSRKQPQPQPALTRPPNS